MHLLRSALALLLLAILCAPAHAESNGASAPPGPIPASGDAPHGASGPTMGQAADDQSGGTAGQKGQTQAAQPADPLRQFAPLLIMLVPIVLVMWISSRNQKKEERRLADLRNAVKRGDRVVTIGGMHGEVMTSGEGTVDLRLGSGDSAPVVTFNKSAIATVAGADKAK